MDVLTLLQSMEMLKDVRRLHFVWCILVVAPMTRFHKQTLTTFTHTPSKTIGGQQPAQPHDAVRDARTLGRHGAQGAAALRHRRRQQVKAAASVVSRS